MDLLYIGGNGISGKRIRPPQFVLHQGANDGSGINAVAPRIELHAEPSRKDVFNRGGHFVVDGIDYFRTDGPTSRKNRVQQNWILRCQLQNSCGRSPELGRQMLGSSFGNRVLEAEPFPIIIGETLTAVEDVVASLGLCLRQAESLLHRVNRV